MEQQREIDCNGVLDITGVAHWRQQALEALYTGMPLCLKVAELQRIDAAGLQAILGLIMAAGQRSIPVRWDSPSPALQQAARLTGLSDYLRLA